MIVDERMVTYINSLDMGNTPLLDEIEQEAKADLVPVIRQGDAELFESAPCDSPAAFAFWRWERLWAFRPFCYGEYGPENMPDYDD